MKKLLKIALGGITIVFLSTVGVFLLFCDEVQATTRNVCPSGCTYSTIQDAVNASSGTNDIINVAPGTYEETVAIPGTGSATYLTIKGAGIDSSIINAHEGSFGFVSGIPVNISGFTINSSLLGIFIVPAGNTGDIVIESNSINSTGTEKEELFKGGIMIASVGGVAGHINESRDINIDSLKNQINKIKDKFPFDFSINDAPELTPISNDIKIINNTIESSGSSINFGIFGLGNFENQVLIEGNTIIGKYVGREFEGFKTGFGIFLFVGDNKSISVKENMIDISGSDAEFISGISNLIVGNSDDIVINNNTVNVNNSNNSFGITSGIVEGSFSSVAIHSNIVKNAGSAGIAAFGIPSDNTSGTLKASIYNNVVYGGLEPSIVIDNSPDAAGVYVGNLLTEKEGKISYIVSAYNNTIYNNVAAGNILESGGIVSNDRATVTAYNNIIAQNSNGLNSSLGGTIISSYNDLYNNTKSGGSNYQGVDPGEGDILDNPNFINTSNTSDNGASTVDLGLAWPSPAIDSGTSKGVPSDDILDNSRPNRGGYDMGAYEYQNQAPTSDARVGTGADAGKDQTVTAGVEVTLDGSKSSDPENDSLTYYWKQTEGPAVTLSDANAEQPKFTPSEVGTYKFSLQVVDEYGAKSKLDTVTITVEQALLPETGADIYNIYFEIAKFIYRVLCWF